MERPASLKSHRQRSDEDLLTALRGDTRRLDKSPAVFGGNRLRYPRAIALLNERGRSIICYKKKRYQPDTIMPMAN
jgi:hypothetical protein